MVDDDCPIETFENIIYIYIDPFLVSTAQIANILAEMAPSTNRMGLNAYSGRDSSQDVGQGVSGASGTD